MKNYYQILGIGSTASSEEIKKAYRLYAAKFHPDKHSGDEFFEERFKEIQEAYQILSDSAKKRSYDHKIKNNVVNSKSYTSGKDNDYDQTNVPGGKTLSFNSILLSVVLGGVILVTFFLSNDDKELSRVAGEQNVEVDFGPAKLFLGQSFLIRIEAKNELIQNYSGFPEIQGFKKAQIVASASLNVIDGDSVTIQSLSQHYQAQKVGSFKLQPFVVEVNGLPAYCQGGSILVMPPSPVR